MKIITANRLSDGRVIYVGEAGAVVDNGLRHSWAAPGQADPSRQILGDAAEQLDLFDRCQLNTVIDTCRNSASLSEAGRRLFAHSRQEKKQNNDADRLRKYLARFELSFEQLRGG